MSTIKLSNGSWIYGDLISYNLPLARHQGIIGDLLSNKMGQRNIHMIDLDRGQDSIHPEPCVVYSSITNLSQSNVHNGLPGRSSNFDLHQRPEHHETALVYGVAPYHQYPATNLNLAVGSTSNHYPPFMAPPHASRDILLPVNHGTNDQLPFSGNPRMVGIPADAYIRNNPYVDGVSGAFKIKNSEGHPWNFQHYALAGSSSSVGPNSNRPLESDATLADPLPFVHLDYGANDTSSIIESGSHRSIRNGPGVMGPESVLAHNHNHLVHGNYVGHPFLLPGNPWLGLQLGSNNGEINGGRWNQPYLPGNISGSGIEVGNMGLQGYQVAPHGHRPMHHPPIPVQGVRGQNMSFASQVPTSSRRFPTNTANLNSFQGYPETGPRYTGPVPPTGFRLFRPHRRESTQEVNNRHRNVPHLRVLPEDGVAIMDFAGFHESGHFMDQHRDMRMDIDQMSYEELLALGEQIGSVGSGLTEEAITSNLRVRLFAASSTCSSAMHEAPHGDHNLDFCVVCQANYVQQEPIATLDCGHEYHAECLKKWLVVKNTCPICKSSALSAGGGKEGILNAS